MSIVSRMSSMRSLQLSPNRENLGPSPNRSRWWLGNTRKRLDFRQFGPMNCETAPFRPIGLPTSVSVPAAYRRFGQTCYAAIPTEPLLSKILLHPSWLFGPKEKRFDFRRFGQVNCGNALHLSDRAGRIDVPAGCQRLGRICYVPIPVRPFITRGHCDYPYNR